MAVYEAIPRLKTLDDLPLSEDHTHNLRSESSLFKLSEAGMEQDWRMVRQSIKDGVGEEGTQTGSNRPKTAPQQSELRYIPLVW